MRRGRPKRQLRFLLVSGVLALGRVFAAASHSADDFDRLFRLYPLVVAGTLHAERPSEGVIAVRMVLKNRPGLMLRPGDRMSVEPNATNQHWLRARLAREPGQMSVWVLDVPLASPSSGRATIIAHFLADEATLASLSTDHDGRPREAGEYRAAVGAQWAVIKVPLAPSYDSTGTYQGTLKAGTCLAVRKVADSSAGEVAVCVLPSDYDGEARETVVRTTDVNLHPGALQDVDEHRKSLLIREAELLAKLTAAREAAAEEAVVGNPYAAEYRRIREAYERFWRQVNDLLQKRDTATGTARMHYLEKLRQLKGQDIQLGMAYEAIKKKYEAWQRAHAKPDLSSPAMRAAHEELEILREEIRLLK